MGIADYGKGLAAIVGIGSIVGGIGFTVKGASRAYHTLGEMRYTDNPLSNFCIDVGQKIGYGMSTSFTLSSIACGGICGFMLYKWMRKGKKEETGKTGKTEGTQSYPKIHLRKVGGDYETTE